MVFETHPRKAGGMGTQYVSTTHPQIVRLYAMKATMITDPDSGKNNSGDEEQKDVHKPKSRQPQMYV